MQTPQRNPDLRNMSLDDAIKLLRIIVAGMAIGSLLFGIVVVALNLSQGHSFVQPTRSQGSFPVPWILGGIAVVILVVGPVISKVMLVGMKSQVPEGESMPMEQIVQFNVISAALIEGPAVLGAVTALLFGLPYLLITLVGGVLLVIRWAGLPEQVRNLASESSSGM